MNPWDSAVLHSVTPAAQKDLDAVPRETHIFSPHLLEAEHVADMKRQTDEKNLELELLKLQKESADVTHSFYLGQRFSALQQFTSHLQEMLREQASLRKRLMKPLCQESLPVEAHLHRHVVELMGMVVDLINNLEKKVKITRSFPTLGTSVAGLNNALAQLLTQVTEVEELSRQVLQWKDLQHNMATNKNGASS
ncbi:hypothetical protein JZ751_002730 [Albula glossodonta]|uniref:HAUS augmin-like complex subunit 2 n=1 Tax=Albula glossodonta TaxID=121402 RepID=A0A8T2N7R6_9TELE|nr:hypothetical protein JZ751_002730 [Albula glossodonta]